MNIDAAITKAIGGQEVKDVKHHEHTFHIKPVKIERAGSKVTAKGRISHDIRFRSDDQIDYSIVKDNGVVQSLDMSIDRGGLGRMIGAAVHVASGYTIPDEVFDKVGKLVDGTWEGACRDIIQRIAIRV